MDVLSSELFKKIRRIEILSTHLAEDILAGAYRSAFKGRGMEFEEVREYLPGDDIRTIDWNVTARMNHPYVKSFREEREMTVNLIVDVSSSTAFGSRSTLKSDLIAEIAAVIAFSAIKNNDKIALILFSDKVVNYYPPRKGTQHILRIIREILTCKPSGHSTDIAAALSFLGTVQNRPGICFLISDFIAPDFSHEAALAAARHDLVPIAICDPSEKSFPDMGLATLADLESGSRLMADTSSETWINGASKRFQEHIDKQKILFQKLGVDLCVIDDQAHYLNQLRKFFNLRRKQHT
jgi:uncharacterized protein (DUF58 family)